MDFLAEAPDQRQQQVLAAGFQGEPREGGAGYARLLKGGRRPMRTKDGWLALLPYTAEHWTAFVSEIGRLDLVAVATDRVARNKHIQELYGAMRDALETRLRALIFGR